MSKVSVLVTNYNYKQYLPARLRSIKNQSYRDFEVVFLDDSSTDGSISVADRLLKRSDIPYKIYKNEVNSGSAFSNWKTGLEMSKGEYIWVAEADDVSHPDFLKQLVKLLEEDSSLGMIYSESSVIDEKNRILSESFYQEVHSRIDPTKWRNNYKNNGTSEIKETLSVMNTIPNVSSVVFRREALEAVLDGVDEFTLSGDWITYIRILENYNIGYVNNILNFHRHHKNGLTTQFNRTEVYLEESLKIMKYLLAEHKISQSRKAAYVRNLMIESNLANNDGFFTPEFQKQLTELLGTDTVFMAVSDFLNESFWGLPGLREYVRAKLKGMSLRKFLIKLRLISV